MADQSYLAEAERFLHEQIPLSKAMEVRVESFDGSRLVMTAPLAPNHNHLGTAFGGSLSALATLTGYCLLWILLENRNAHIVIRRSSIQYAHPVRGTLRAVCESPGETALSDFKAHFEKKGKARISLPVRIEAEERTCVKFEGEFVAIT